MINCRGDRIMRQSQVRFLAAFVVLLLLGKLLFAQQQAPAMPSPRLLIVTPPGGKAGDTVEVTLTGQELDGPQDLLFSVPGIKAELVKEKPPADAKKPMAKQPNQQATTVVKFKVTIPADVPPGIHDVRMMNALGVSNPRAFVVGDLPETLEKEPNNDVPEAQRVSLNCTVNGSIAAPTDVDYYVFTGKKGQRVVASCLASSIDSRLFAGLEFYSKQGTLLAANREYAGTDALLDCTLPDDGDYYVRVFAFTYTQGSAEHFYRLTISTAPWIDAIYPPIVEPGKKTAVTIYGRNLPGGKLDPAAVVDGRALEKLTYSVDAPADPAARFQLRSSGYVPQRSSALDGFELRLRNEVGVSNAYLLTYARAPIVLDNEANDTEETAQVVGVPCDIAGRIEKRRDRDWYRFTAHKGEVYSIEVFGDRLGSPVDMYYTLRPASAKGPGQEFDDNPDILSPTLFFSRTDDPQRQRFVAPADGDYLLQVSSRDADLRGGPRHLYHVRISPEEPDFRLIVMPPTPNLPDACVLRQDGRAYYTVLVWRLDGFNGEVRLSADGLPQGVTCPQQIVGPNQKQASLILTAAADAPVWTGNITIRGTATINGAEVVREARSASITWPGPAQQQNIALVSRLDRNLVLAVREKAPYTLTAGVGELGVTPGQRVTIPLKLVRHWSDLKANVQVTLLNAVQPAPFNFNNNQPLNLGKDEQTVTLNVNNNAPAGTYTIAFRGQVVAPLSKELMAKEKRNVALVQPSSPITITVLPSMLATVSLSQNALTLKPGAEAEVVVKVNRLNNFKGAFNVHLALPEGMKGIEAKDVEIPADKSEARMVVKAAEDAATGNRAGVVVQVTARLREKVEIKQEAKLNVNVGK
jgi:hypothetical protein